MFLFGYFVLGSALKIFSDYSETFQGWCNKNITWMEVEVYKTSLKDEVESQVREAEGRQKEYDKHPLLSITTGVVDVFIQPPIMLTLLAIYCIRKRG